MKKAVLFNLWGVVVTPHLDQSFQKYEETTGISRYVTIICLFYVIQLFFIIYMYIVLVCDYYLFVLFICLFYVIHLFFIIYMYVYMYQYMYMYVYMCVYIYVFVYIYIKKLPKILLCRYNV